MNLTKLSVGVRNRFLKTWHRLLSILGADWTYEKSFFYLIVATILLYMLLKGIALIDEIKLGHDFIWTVLLLSLGILVIAFLFAFGARLLVKAVKNDFK
ncbi:MAG: hypothetical protein ACR2MX_18800 [Cyclobacteriaceae bacterium]